MTRKRLAIWGARGHARVLTDIARLRDFEVVAFGDREKMASPVDDIPIYHGREHFIRAVKQHQAHYYAVAIGGSRGHQRLAIAAWLDSIGLEAITLKHPTAVVEPSAHVSIGAQLLAMAFVGASANVGSQAILNSRASLDHDSIVADGVHMAPGAIACGEVSVGRSAFLGAGSTVLPRIKIGAEAIIGAGSVVTRDIEQGATVVGVPARQRDPAP